MNVAQYQATSSPNTVPAHSSGLETLNARRSYAYAAGEAVALERKVSADAYLFLYKELVRLCKDGTRCWPGLAWLCERLGTSEGTIKRWLAELVSAELIRRAPRAGGMTTLTTVIPLERFDTTGPDRNHTHDDPGGKNDQHGREGDNHDPFFLRSRQLKSGTLVGSQSIPLNHSKNPKLKVGGGVQLHEVDITDAVKLLQQRGVVAPAVLNELKHVPVDTIERCFAVARSRPQVVDPPGFAVALLRRRAARSNNPRRQSPDDASCRAVAKEQAIESVVQAPTPGAAQPTTLEGIWKQVIELLRTSTDETTFETWCQDTALEILDTVAVVSVTNCFQRDAVERQFNDLISAALAATTGQIRDVRYVIR